MTPEQFRRVRELFAQAQQREAAARPAFVRAACAGDSELEREVLELLRHVGPTDDDGGARAPGSDPLLGRAIGPYVVESLLGAGGMGAVYEARHTKTGQAVALKIIRPGYATAEMLRRFEYEFRALAQLAHPGIARIYHADSEDLGGGPQPYFAMELVRGRSLIQYASEQRLPLRRRLELALQIADIVQYLHQQGVIHRDLKPGNILVDEVGQAKILDFGVARATGATADSSLHTSVGQLVGTLRYMSPEQASGDPLEVDTRADIYSLGVLTYELLSGQLPYPLQERMPHEVVRIIREQEPTRISHLNSALRGDVETIIAKALEKDKRRRYASAGALADDIRRYLKDEPILARSPSATDQLVRFARRNKVLVSAVATVLITLSGALVLTARLAAREAAARRDAERITQAFLGVISAADPVTDRGDEVTIRGVLPQLEDELLKLRGVDPGFRSMLEAQLSSTWWRLGAADRALPLIDSAIANLVAAKGADSVDANVMRLNRCVYMSSLGHDEEALSEALAARIALEKKLGSAAVHVTRSRQIRAAILVNLARIEEGETELAGVRAAQESNAATPLVDRFATLQTLAQIAHFRNRNAEAAQLAAEGIGLVEYSVGADHPDVIIARRNLAFYEGRLGNNAQPMGLLETVAADEKRVHRILSPNTVLIQAETALYAARDFEAALRYAHEALDMLNHAPASAGRLWALEIAGQALYKLQRIEEAAAVYDSAVTEARQSGTLSGFEGLILLNNLAQCLVQCGGHDRAILLYQELIPLKRAAGRDKDGVFTINLNNLGRLLYMQGRAAEAEPWLREARDRQNAALSAPHPDRVLAAWKYAQALIDMERLTEAEGVLRLALDESEALDEEAMPQLPVTVAALVARLRDLAACDPGQGHAERAEDWENRLSLLGES